MRVLLLTSSFEDDHRIEGQDNSHYPLGLAYLHSVLKEFHEVETLFLNNVEAETCLNEVKLKVSTAEYDVIGLNIMTQNRVSSYQIIEFLRQYGGRYHILIGGVHASVMWEQILTKYPGLIAVLGEGERTVVELLDKLSHGYPFYDVLGVAYNEDGRLVKTGDRPLIQDLDSLPFPEHDLFFHKERTLACVISSRGCPFRCSFCVLGNISNRKVRFRSPANVVDEIEQLKEKYPKLETVWFHDDQFLMDNQRVIDICREIVDRRIQLKFVCSGRFKPFSADVAAAMNEAGFVHLLFGLETGSSSILRASHKAI